MARKCKCKYCNSYLTTDNAYCYTKDDKNYYFCNENHFILACERKAKTQQEKAEYDEIYNITKEIFGYEFTGYSLLKREITTWEKLSTRQKIISYLKDNQEWLSDVMSKDFASDYNRVRYYSTIIAGKLHDWNPKIKEEAKVIDKKSNMAFYDISDVVNRPTRRALDDLEDEI